MDKIVQEVRDQVWQELSGSNFSLEIKDMVVEELESKFEEVVRGYMDEIKEELISSVAEKVSELIAQNPALLHPRGSAALRALEGWARGPD